METLRLEGSTIRGLVQGRTVNCLVRSVPDGLVLPRGQYVLRSGENNPIYGQLISIESAHGPAGMEHVGIHFKMPPSALKDSPAAVATLVPSKPAYSAILKEVPGWKLPPTRIRDTGAGKVDAPAAKFDAPSIKFDGVSAKFFVPGEGMTARVIIAVRPIGQNSLVAQAGFSDLLDALQRAGGGLTLIVP